MKAYNITEIIRLASITSVLLPMVMYLIRARRATAPMHLVGAVTIISALSDVIANLLYSREQSTVVLFNLYYSLLFLLLTGFYYRIVRAKGGRTTVVAGLIVYLLSFALITLYVQAFTEYQTMLWTIIGIIIIVYGISYFLYLFSSQQSTTSYGLLWINGGFLFYFSFNLFLFITSSYVLTELDPEVGMLVWSFHNVNNIVKNILLGLGLYLPEGETQLNSFAQSETLSRQR